MTKTKITIQKIFQSYRESTGNLKFYSLLLFAIFLAIFWSIEPLIFTEIIKKIESFISTWELQIEEIIKISIFWWIFTWIYIVLAYCFDYFFLAKTIIKNYHDQSLFYADKIMQMSYGNYLWRKVWAIYKILDRWTENQLFFLYGTLLWVLRSLVSIIFISIILIVLDWRMALVTLCLVPIAVISGAYIYRKVGPSQKLQDEVYAEWFSIIWNGLSNFWLTKILWLERNFYFKMKEIFDSSFPRQLRIQKWWSIGHWYIVAIVMISRIIVISAGLYFITLWEISFSTLFLFFSYIGWIYFPLWFLFDQLRQFQKYLTAVELMHDQFDDIEYENTNAWNKLSNTQWLIEFKSVHFWYSAEKKILSNINLQAKPGQKIALVWNTGAGKSTIVNLLLRFWDISDWEILLDGININTIQRSSLRSHIGVVSQDNSLFNLSIEENLKFANPKATQDDLEDALKKAEAHFVFDLPQWLQTVIWERWLKLSGWEKQRISIARLFLKNPEILLLDEATSALDNRTEKLIQKSLDRLMEWKTSIIIAHRLSTIRHADVIYVLEWGKVVEFWNYEDLMKQKEKFFELANPEKLILW